MNAPFSLCEEVFTQVDLADPGEAARITDFVYRWNGSPFHLPKWLTAVERGTGQKATGLIAEKGGELTGWLPLSVVHSLLFPRALVSSGFAVDGGVLASSPTTARKLCQLATELAQREACASVELRGGTYPDDWDVQSESHCNFSGPLADDDEAQLLAIPRKQRAEVRKGLKNELRVTIGSGAEDRQAHYACYAESVRNLGTPVFPHSLFDAVLDAFGDEADILTVWAGGRAVASVLSLYHMGAAMPYWGGGRFEARHLRANEVMYYQLMCHARSKGCIRFDFGRSKTGSGPYNFKKNWGFDPEPLTYGTWTAAGGGKRDVDPTSDAYSRKIQLWKRLPLSVANRIGPLIARGLG
ncbi:FemAB family XrtA/PEP-CTERM system-associated protein [Parerythrobacter jejuensis]|uniref:FemAB family PEP-CTERM system-associated protein n=1 Tax=Parerythrobacter jejuensis TaxID=795812 RepID=A0A845ATM3_9SPHN|nr:FemAB family XrtA/PEP-CTERM system-associated protein [Parerythrobacter jejuensis]MXP32493.1 FemAB family PEP-CTERM system-associated protein [Parerythrobacter jejuensis]